MAHEHAHDDEQSPLQGYFDWQVNTLMLAYDLKHPIGRGDAQGAMQRRAQVEREVSDFTLALVPDIYKNDASLEWPPSIMMAITRETLKKAAELAGVGEAASAA